MPLYHVCLYLRVQVFIFDMPSSLLEFIHQVSDSCSSSNLCKSSWLAFVIQYGVGAIHTYMCVKQSILSVCLFVTTKIARSGDVGIRATRKHNESIEVGK